MPWAELKTCFVNCMPCLICIITFHPKLNSPGSGMVFIRASSDIVKITIVNVMIWRHPGCDINLAFHLSGSNAGITSLIFLNTLRSRQNDHHFPDDIFKCIFLNENEWILIKISLECVLKGQISKIPPLVQIMAWRRPGDKPLSEPMMVCLLTHICVTRPQWVKKVWTYLCRISMTLGIITWYHNNWHSLSNTLSTW